MAAGEGVRVAIRVRPGAARTRVGGRYGDGAAIASGDRARLVVAVAERAVDGRATEAALAAVAAAFGVRRRHVTLVTGATSRDKIVAVAGREPGDVRARLAGLLGP